MWKTLLFLLVLKLLNFDDNFYMFFWGRKVQSFHLGLLKTMLTFPESKIEEPDKSNLRCFAVVA